MLSLVIFALGACSLPNLNGAPGNKCLHEFGEWGNSTATCTEDGVETRVCGLCEESEERAATALGHDMKTVEEVAPTCTEDGVSAHTKCSRCDATDGLETIGATGHSMVAIDEVEATCTVDGTTAHNECSVCGETEGREVIKAPGHDMIAVDEVKASCTVDGATAHSKCSVCGEKEGFEVIEAPGHDITTVEAKAPTATSIGWNAYEYCNVCDYTTYEEIPATPDSDVHVHVFGAWSADTATCTEGGVIIRECIVENCQFRQRKSTEPLGHDNETVEAKDPTFLESGWEEYTVCKRCGVKSNYKELPATGATAEVLPVKGGAGGIVSIVHDDGNIDTVYELERLFYQYDIVGSLGLMSDNNKTTNNLPKWKEILATGRWKVASHSATHTWWGIATDNGDGTYTFSDDWDYVIKEVVTSQQKLRDMFPGQRVLAFIYPGFAAEKTAYAGAYSGQVGSTVYNKIREFIYSPAARQLIADNYIVARYDSTLSGNKAYVDEEFDFYYMNGGFISNSSYTGGTIKANLDDAANGGFHLFSLHTCTESGEITPKNMEEVCKLIKQYVDEGKVWNAFYEDAALYVKEAQNATVSVEIDGGTIKVTLTDTLADDIYNYPLTVRMTVPEEWAACKIVQGDNVTYAVAKELDGKWIIDADIIPDGGVATVCGISVDEIPDEPEITPVSPVGPDKPITSIDATETFDGTSPNYTVNSDNAGFSETTLVTPENYQGGKMLSINKTAAGKVNYWTLLNQKNKISAEAMKVSFKIAVDESTGSNSLMQIYFYESNDTPYYLTVNATSGGFYIGDIDSNNGASKKNNLTGTLEFGRVYEISVDICITGKGGFLATIYVDGEEVAESTNYGNYSKTENAAPKTTVQAFKFSALKDSKFKARLDDVSIKAGTYAQVGLTPVPAPEEPDVPDTPEQPEGGYTPNEKLAIDKYIDFETDPGISASGAGTVAFGDRDGGKTIKMLDDKDSMGHWKIPFGTTANVEKFIFTFDVNVATASSSFNTTFYFADTDKTPYMMYLQTSSGSYFFGDCQSNSNGAGKTTTNLSGALNYNTWYTIKIEVVINGSDGFKAVWYVKDAEGSFVKTGESTNFANFTKAEGATAKNTISYFRASSLSNATVEMYFDNMIMQAGNKADFNATVITPAVDKTFTFDNGTEGLSSGGSVTYSSAAPTLGATNALYVDKAVTGYKSGSLSLGTTVKDATSFVVEFDIYVEKSNNTTMSQITFNTSLEKTPYDLLLIGNADGFKFGDLSNASGGTTCTYNMSSLSYNKTYKIKVAVNLGDSADDFLATLYVDGAEIGSSTNYYKVNNSTNPPMTEINSITFHWQNSSTHALYIDNLNLKVYNTVAEDEGGEDTPTDTPEEEGSFPADSDKKDGYISFTDQSDKYFYEGNAHTVKDGKLYTNNPGDWNYTVFTNDDYRSNVTYKAGAQYIFEAEYTYLGGNVPEDSSGIGFIGFLNAAGSSNKCMLVSCYLKYGSDTNGDGTPDSVSFFGQNFQLGKTYSIKLVQVCGDTSYDVKVYVDGKESTYDGNKGSSLDVSSDEVLYGFGVYYRSAVRISGYEACWDNVKVSVIGEKNEVETDFSELLPNGHRIDVNYFPGFVRKSVSFTLDDGIYQHDKKVVDILKPAGFTGTFNINNPSSITDPSIYDGFEIANHNILHAVAMKDSYKEREFVDAYIDEVANPDTTKVYKKKGYVDGQLVDGMYVVYIGGSWHPMASDETYIQYLEWTTKELEKIFGEGSVVGFAYPHGNQYNDAIIAYLQDAGYLYGRRTGNLKATTGFALPTDRYTWTYNADHNCLLEVMREYDRYADDGELKMFSFGVHAKDFETYGKWEDLEEFAALYGNRSEDFWYATNHQIFEYEDAIKGLVINDEKIINPSAIDVYIKVDGNEVIIKAGGEYLFGAPVEVLPDPSVEESFDFNTLDKVSNQNQASSAAIDNGALTLTKNEGYNEFKVGFNSSTASAGRIEAEFKMMVPNTANRTNGTVAHICFDGSKSPYIMIINTASDKYYLGDKSKLSGGTAQNLFEMQYDVWYTVKVTVTIEQTGVEASLEVIDASGSSRTATSSNASELYAPTPTVSCFMIACPKAAVFTVKIDKLEVKAWD